MKRVSREARRTDPLGPVWGADTALSVAALKDLREQLRTDMITGDRFEKVIFKLDDISDDMVILRHSEDCRSKVMDGRCAKCGCSTEGVWCFRMDMMLQDTQKPHVKLELCGFAAVGRSLFGGKSAREVACMSQNERDDVIDKWTEVAVLAKCALKYDPEADTVKCNLYDLKRLRDEWLEPLPVPDPPRLSGEVVATEALRNASGLGREMIEGEEAVELAAAVSGARPRGSEVAEDVGARPAKSARRARA